MKKKRVVPDFPPRGNPPGHAPHVIDWDQVTKLIQEDARENREALILMCRGDYEGVGDYYD